MQRTGMKAVAVVTFVGAVCAWSMTAVADEVVNLINQDRSVVVMVSVPPCGQHQFDGTSEFADDFEPFSPQLLAEVNCREAGATSNGWQESEITPSVLTAASALENVADSDVMAIIHSLGASLYEVTFEVTSTAAFQMFGDLAVARDAAMNQMARPSAEFRLTGPDGVVVVEGHIHAEPGETEGSLDINSTGLLPPGIYTYRVAAENIIDAAIPPAAEISSSFDVTMHIGAARTGDLNGDGVVDALDMLFLLGSWGECADQANCPADLNGDGEVNGLDLLILLSNWG